MCLFWQLKNLNQFFLLSGGVCVSEMKRRRANTSAKCKWSCIHDSMSILWSFVCAELDAMCLFIYDVIRLLEHFVVCVWPCALLRSVCLGFLLLCVEAKVCACLFVHLCGCVSEFTCCGMQGDWQVLSCSYLGILRKTKTYLLSEVIYVTYTQWNGTNILISYSNLIFSWAWLLVSNMYEVWCLTQILLSSCSSLTLRLMVSLSPQGTNYPLQLNTHIHTHSDVLGTQTNVEQYAVFVVAI